MKNIRTLVSANRADMLHRRALARDIHRALHPERYATPAPPVDCVACRRKAQRCPACEAADRAWRAELARLEWERETETEN